MTTITVNASLYETMLGVNCEPHSSSCIKMVRKNVGNLYQLRMSSERMENFLSYFEEVEWFYTDADGVECCTHYDKRPISITTFCELYSRAKEIVHAGNGQMWIHFDLAEATMEVGCTVNGRSYSTRAGTNGAEQKRCLDFVNLVRKTF